VQREDSAAFAGGTTDQPRPALTASNLQYDWTTGRAWGRGDERPPDYPADRLSYRRPDLHLMRCMFLPTNRTTS